MEKNNGNKMNEKFFFPIFPSLSFIYGMSSSSSLSIPNDRPTDSQIIIKTYKVFFVFLKENDDNFEEEKKTHYNHQRRQRNVNFLTGQPASQKRKNFHIFVSNKDSRYLFVCSQKKNIFQHFCKDS